MNNSLVSIIERTTIPTKPEFIRLGAMMYLAVIAYPKKEDWPKRQKFIDAATAFIVKLGAKKGKLNKKDFPDHIRKIAQRDMYNTLDMAQKRIFTDRLAALQIADRLAATKMTHEKSSLHKVVRTTAHDAEISHSAASQVSWNIPAGTAFVAVEGLSPLTLAKISPDRIKNGIASLNIRVSVKDSMVKVANTDDGAGAGDSVRAFEKRIWRPSAPAIHLMLALRAKMQILDMWGASDVIDLIFRAGEWLNDSVESAERLRAMAPALWNLDPAHMIEIGVE